MRIVQVISSSATSGAERHVYSLSRLLTQRGHHVEVVCPPNGWLANDLRQANIPVHTFDMKGSGWLRTTGFLAKRLRNDFDLVHTHLTRATYFGAVAGLLTNVPAIASVHIANHDQIYKRMAMRRNRLVAVSNYVRGMLHGRGIPDRFIDTVYNGTDFVEFDPSPPEIVKEEFGIDHSHRIVGLVGRVSREKGHLLMLEAMSDVIREHKDVHLMLVGRIEPTFEEEFNEAVDRAGVRERLVMTGVRQDIPRLLDGFEMTAMPSHRETFGIAAIEAMARSRPVVASRIGGLPEVVRHGQTGLLIDLRPDELRNAVSYLLENEREAKEMGALGRRLVEEKFTLGHMASRLETVYRKAMGQTE